MNVNFVSPSISKIVELSEVRQKYTGLWNVRTGFCAKMRAMKISGQCEEARGGEKSCWKQERMQWMKAKLNTIISNIILWWSCERVKWDEWNAWNSIFLVSLSHGSLSLSLVRLLTVRFSWNLLININIEMVTRIMVLAFLSVLVFGACAISSVVFFSSRSFAWYLAYFGMLSEYYRYRCSCCYYLFFIVFFRFENLTHTLTYRPHVFFLACKFIA